jgi:hypothetical protein
MRYREGLHFYNGWSRCLSGRIRPLRCPSCIVDHFSTSSNTQHKGDQFWHSTERVVSGRRISFHKMSSVGPVLVTCRLRESRIGGNDAQENHRLRPPRVGPKSQRPNWLIGQSQASFCRCLPSLHRTEKWSLLRDAGSCAIYSVNKSSMQREKESCARCSWHINAEVAEILALSMHRSVICLLSPGVLLIRIRRLHPATPWVE